MSASKRKRKRRPLPTLDDVTGPASPSAFEMPLQVTREMIESGKSEAGGWKLKQLKLLGVPA